MHSHRRSLAAGAALATLLAGTALADPRFVSVTPGTAPGAWTASVTGASGPLTFLADGKPVPAQVTSDGGLVRATLSGVPAGTSMLGVADGGGTEAEAAILLSPTDAIGADLAVYHIMVGHFANGNRSNDRDQMRGFVHKNYVGGDLQGLLERVDHIASLGVTAVWLSPIFAAETSHGYDVTNYYAIGGARAVPGDPSASLALFRQVRDALQQRGIKVILDVPLNHAHQNYDRRAGDPDGLKPKATGPKQQAERTWDSWGAKFRYWDMDHQPTRDFLKKVALHWLVAEKVDGIRLDYVRGVDHEFWADLYKEIRAVKPDAFIVGEAWDDKAGVEAMARDIALYRQPVEGIGPQFDAAFDFPVQYAITDAFGRGRSLAAVEEWLQRGEAIYGPVGRPAYFLDNHDLARLGAWANDDDKVLAAVGLLSALSGPVFLFYGTETGLSHPAPQAGFTDASRVAMPWDGLNMPMVARTTEYLTARRDNPVLHRGARLPLLADDTALVMAKRDGATVALVGTNLAESARQVTLDVGGLLKAGAILTPLAGGGPAPTVGADGTATWTLPPRSTQIAITPKS